MASPDGSEPAGGAEADSEWPSVASLDWGDIGVTYAKGLAMGTADAIPGVSGGTIALITGIYERLIDAIAAFDPVALTGIVRPQDAEARADLAAMLGEMDVPFLVALLAGIGTAVVAVLRVVHVVLESAPGPTYAFFFGLIGASAVALYAHVELDEPMEWGAAGLGIAIGWLLTGQTSAGALTGANPLVTFLLGALAISAMVLPGVSGAFILLLFGMYDPMSDALAAFTDALLALLSGGSLDAVVEPGVTVVTFVAGAGLGVLTFARVIRYALDNHRSATMAFLVSLMVGALRLPAIKVLDATASWDAMAAIGVVLPALFGAFGVVLLEFYTDDLEYA